MERIKNLLRPTYRKFQRGVNRVARLFRIAMGAPLVDFVFNIHSSNGEDGLVEELFRRLNIYDGWMVEFGAWDGILYSNTYAALRSNRKMKAVYIEGDPVRFQDLKRLSDSLPNKIVPVNAFVEPSGTHSLDNLLATTPIPKKFELLSIDVDGIDYQIWQGCIRYSPKIVIVEVNCSLPITSDQIHDMTPGAQGTSFKKMLELGNSKGYTLVWHKGNMVFVRNDVCPLLHTDIVSTSDQMKLFQQK